MTMNCPSCGAEIRMVGHETSVVCSQCGTAITVSGQTNADISAALGMLGNIPGMNELMQKAMQLKRVKELLQAGNRLEAIKVYRELTGASLEQAVDAIDALEKGQPLAVSDTAQIFSKATATLDADATARIESLLRSGNKIEAIKVYRELTGLGLKDAKDAVEALEVGQPLVITSTQAPAQTSFGSDDDFVAEIKNKLSRNQKIDAIKIYRERYKVGLKEAKDAVEAMAMGIMPQQMPSVSQPKYAASSKAVISENPFDRDEKKGSGCNWIVLGIGLLALLLLGACVALGLYLGLFNQLFGG